MLKPWEVVAELESDNSRLFKESVIKREAEATNDILFAGLRLCYDPMVTFGVKQVPESGTNGPGLTWSAFDEVANHLASRALTGDAARDRINSLINTATQEQWNNWYRRILIKDMRAGFSEKTINTVVKKINKEYVIPLFECQLAHDSANHEEKVSGEKLIEVKLDGVRVLTIVYPNGRVDQYSRNGKELVNFPHIRRQFAAIVGDLSEPMVFDGEVMSSSFQDLMKQVHRKDNVESSDAVLHLFDICPLENFKQGRWEVDQLTRSSLLNSFVDNHRNGGGFTHIQVLNQEQVNLDTAKGQKQFKEINERAIEGGYEGIMIKNPKSPYECKRSVAWLKLKPFIEVSLTVVGIEEGTGKNAGRLGALICEGTDDSTFIRTNVGSGLTDQFRDEIWSNKALVVGQVVEIRADAKTRSQDSEDVFSLRFPRFIRFRGFENGEKI